MKHSMEKHVWTTPKLVTENDWEKLRDVRIKAAKDSPEAFADTSETNEARPEKEWRTWSNNAYQYAIETNGQYVAIVVLRRDPSDGVWLINGVWTDPAYRGQGLSTKLFETAFNKARALGVTRIELSVNAKQKDALELYTHLGFVEKTKKAPKKYADGKEYESVVMEIDLEKVQSNESA